LEGIEEDLILTYLLLEIHSEKAFSLVLCFKQLDSFCLHLNLRIFDLDILFDSHNLAGEVCYTLYTLQITKHILAKYKYTMSLYVDSSPTSTCFLACPSSIPRTLLSEV
jgi:hypothetical protein